MKTDTHGNGHGLNDLYILPECPEEARAITDYLGAKGIRYEWTTSDVEGQDWFGRQFIEVPFGESLLGCIAQAGAKAMAKQECHYGNGADCNSLPQGVYRSKCLPCQARDALADA